MKKLRVDAKPIDLDLATKLYWQDGLTLAEVATIFSVHPTNLLMRFRKYGIPRRTISQAVKGKPRPNQCGENNPAWKGGYTTKPDGYIVNGTTKRGKHREVVEKVLGRKLKRNEVVHHVDGDRGNNANSNLLLCSHSYHAILHARMSNNMIGINYTK